MTDNWDKDYNADSLTAEEILEVRHNLLLSEQQEYNRDRVQLPVLDREVLSANFPAFSAMNLDTDANDWEWKSRYTANRMIWICHSCGSFGYRQTYPKETFKCNNYWCKSRNVTICNCGELSMAIRNANVGLNMRDVYARRRERLRRRRHGTNN